MDFGFIRASSVDYRHPNITSDRVVYSYDGYSSYLLIVDDKSSMSWILLTKSKSPPVEIVRLFLCTFGRDRTLGGFIRCNQGGDLAQSQAFIDMALMEFGYKVEPTGANSPSQNGQAEKMERHLCRHNPHPPLRRGPGTKLLVSCAAPCSLPPQSSCPLPYRYHPF